MGEVVDLVYARRGREMAHISCGSCGEGRWFLMVDPSPELEASRIIAVRCACCSGQFDLTQFGIMPPVPQQD